MFHIYILFLLKDILKDIIILIFVNNEVSNFLLLYRKILSGFR